MFVPHSGIYDFPGCPASRLSDKPNIKCGRQDQLPAADRCTVVTKRIVILLRAQVGEGVVVLGSVLLHLFLGGQHFVAFVDSVDIANGDAPLAGGVLNSGDVVVSVSHGMVEITEVQGHHRTGC